MFTSSQPTACRLRQRSKDEAGFSLIELLVTILIVGILASVAIPSLLGQKSKAGDSSAKELAGTAETTAETYATDHSGEYTGLSAEVLKEYEASIQVGEGNNNAYLVAGNGAGTGVPKATATEYEVTATSTNGHTFTVHREANGAITRTCTPAGKTGSEGGGCQNGTW